MLRLKKSMVVNPSVEEVFSYLADFRRHGEWDGAEDLRVAYISPGPLGVGKTCIRKGVRDIYGGGDISGGGYTHEKTVNRTKTVTGFVPNERLVFKMTDTGALPQIIYFELEPANEGTRITKSSGVSISPWFWPLWAFISPVVWPLFQIAYWSENVSDLRRIKRRLSPEEEKR